MINPLSTIEDPAAAKEVQAGTVAEYSPTGFAATGKRITNWTSNLLATAIVVIIALVAGSHLVSSFAPLTGEGEPSLTPELANVWPVLESCALQFGNSDIELQRDSISGNRETVIAFLQSKCQKVLEQSDGSAGPLGQKETRLTQLLKTSAVEPALESPGQWRIFHIEKSELNSPLPLVIGIRDNVRQTNDSPATTENSTTNSRLAVWGIALPEGPLKNDTTDTTGDKLKGAADTESETTQAKRRWKSFVGRTIVEDELNRLKNDLIPQSARRTLAIAGPNGGSLIGFSGGAPEPTKQFFDQLAANRSWKPVRPWQQTGDSWSVSYELPGDSAARGIQVQLHANHTQTMESKPLRGMLIVRSKLSPEQ